MPQTAAPIIVGFSLSRDQWVGSAPATQALVFGAVGDGDGLRDWTMDEAVDGGDSKVPVAVGDLRKRCVR